MSDTIQKYKDYVMTGFMKQVVPIVIDHANAATVTDENGRDYLDCFSGISVVNAGHCNPQVIAAAKAQMEKLVHCSSYIYHVQPVADLAEKIAHIAPRGLTKTWVFLPIMANESAPRPMVRALNPNLHRPRPIIFGWWWRRSLDLPLFWLVRR